MGTSASFALARKITACIIAALLSLALVPASALAEDGRSGAEGSEGAFGSEVPTSPQPPSDPSAAASAEVQSADAKAADSTGDAATGTTIKIAVYRSSYPLAWDLNDAGAADATKAKWDNKPDAWPSLRSKIALVNKAHQLYGGATESHLQKAENETIWLASAFEILGQRFSDWNDAEKGVVQYQAFQNDSGSPNKQAIKTFDNSAVRWWTRSAWQTKSSSWCRIMPDGSRNYNEQSIDGSSQLGIILCFCL